MLVMPMTWLGEVWSRHHGTRFIVAIRASIVKHFPIDDAYEAESLAQRLDADGWDVYYAPSQFNGERRKAADVAAVPALWVDLDAGPGKLHETATRALESLLSWVERRTLPAPTHIVRSGAGLHVYWLLDAPVPLEQWQPVANQFKRALAADRVADDLGCTTDAARILRVPGTHNHKTDDPVEVEVLHASELRVRLDDVRSALPELGPQRSERPQGEWAVDTPLPAGDIARIETGCAQMARVKETGGQVPEPLWRAALSVLWRCDGGEDLIHEWSKGDPRYNARQTEHKARGTAGPATCEHFADMDPERCKGCPWAGKVTSPIQIGVTVTEAVPAADNEPWRKSRINNFIITSGGVWLNRDEDKPKQVTRVPLWVVEVRERAKRESHESDDASLLLEWVGVDGRVKRAVVPQRMVFASDQQLKGWAAQENLASAISDWRLLVTFISQYTLDNIKGSGSRQYHETLGWFNDGFVVGDRMVTADGVRDSLVQTSNPIGKVKPAAGGSWQAWTEAVALLDQPKYLAHQFVVQCGFGSALLEICNLQSAVVSLCGPPGTGKTLSANVALSIYGDPQHLRQGAASSIKAMEKQLAANRNVPFLIDEITQWRPAQAGQIVYMAANGQGDSKLTRARENFAVGQWRLVPIVTSNRPLLDYSQTQITAPHRARLVEIFMGETVSRNDGGPLARAIEQDHYGTACVPYLQWLCDHRSEVRGLVDDAVRKITGHFVIPDAHRFGIWTLATAWVGGVIAHSLGLIKWDPWASVEMAAKELVGAADEVKDPEELARDLVSEWLTENNDRIVAWDFQDKIGYTAVRDPIARSMPEQEEIALHKRHVQELLADNGVSRRACHSLFSGDRLVAEKRLCLAPSTAPVQVYIVKWYAVGFEP